MSNEGTGSATLGVPGAPGPAVPEGASGPSPAAPDAAQPAPGGSGTAPEPGRAGRPLDLLHNVEMSVTVELGRTRMLMRDLLELRPGGIVELDRSAGAPVDLLVNGTLLARGEVVVVDDELGVRITEIAGPEPHAG